MYLFYYNVLFFLSEHIISFKRAAQISTSWVISGNTLNVDCTFNIITLILKFFSFEKLHEKTGKNGNIYETMIFD